MTPAPTPEPSPAPLSSLVKHDVHALLAAVDLLRQGFAVFHKLGRATPCDLVIVRGRRCWRVTVRTVYSVSRHGSLFPLWRPDPDRFDVQAYVLPDGVIRYEPPLAHLHASDAEPSAT